MCETLNAAAINQSINKWIDRSTDQSISQSREIAYKNCQWMYEEKVNKTKL